MTYLVAWCIKTEETPVITDHWEVYKELEHAQARYSEVLKFYDLYTASIFSNVVESTDYSVTPQPEG